MKAHQLTPLEIKQYHSFRNKVVDFIERESEFYTRGQMVAGLLDICADLFGVMLSEGASREEMSMLAFKFAEMFNTQIERSYDSELEKQD